MMVVALALAWDEPQGLERRCWALPWSARGERALWALLKAFHASGEKRGSVTISLGDAEAMARGEETRERLEGWGVKRVALLNLSADDMAGMEALGRRLSELGAVGPLRERRPFADANRPLGALGVMAALWESEQLSRAAGAGAGRGCRRGL